MQPVPYLPAGETKLPLTPLATTRAPRSGEVTCLSLRFELGGGTLLLRTECLGTGWGSPLLQYRIASLWAALWPQALPPPSAPIPPSADTIGAVCSPQRDIYSRTQRGRMGVEK